MSVLSQKENIHQPGEKLLSVEVTSRCNIQCLHCFVKHQVGDKLCMPFDVAANIIKEGYDLGYRRLHFTGGEPLLWTSLFKALNYAFNLGYKSVLINTNGTLLSTENCCKLSDYDGLKITVSLDGPEELHNRIRGDGSYNRTMQGIEKAVNAVIDPVIFTTVYRSLLPKLSDFVMDLLRKFPTIEYVCLIPLERVGNGDFALTGEILAPDDFVRLVRTLPLLNLAGIKVELLNDTFANVVSKILKYPVIRWSQPFNSQSSVIVMSDGRIRPSHFSKKSFGYYKAGMLREVLKSRDCEKRFSRSDSTCSCCDHIQVCRENGMFRPMEEFTPALADRPYCRRVLDLIMCERH